jgi:hypothetical protein
MAIKYNANYIETMPFSDTCIQVHCVANTEETFTVPGNDTHQFQAYFEYTSDSVVFVANNATPTVPAGGTVGEEQYNEFKPKKRYVKGGDILHFISPDASAYIGVSFRQLQG